MEVFTDLGIGLMFIVLSAVLGTMGYFFLSEIYPLVSGHKSRAKMHDLYYRFKLYLFIRQLEQKGYNVDEIILKTDEILNRKPNSLVEKAEEEIGRIEVAQGSVNQHIQTEAS